MDKLEAEISFLKHELDQQNFEQNHLLSDWMPRIVLLATISVTFSLGLFSLDYYLIGAITIFLGVFEMSRQSLDLKKERDKIIVTRIRLHSEIFKKYQELIHRKI